MHFTKDEENFRFCVELISAIPHQMNLTKVGVDMDFAIFNGFQSVICKLFYLYRARHLQQKNEKVTESWHQKISVGLKLTTRKSLFRVSLSLQVRV